jgi:hypothetical protein
MTEILVGFARGVSRAIALQTRSPPVKRKAHIKFSQGLLYECPCKFLSVASMSYACLWLRLTDAILKAVYDVCAAYTNNCW